MSVPRAILICLPNSAPFEERNLSLKMPVKIGRSLHKICKPAEDNAIFDCKVLSRHHAVLSYENSQFFIQDTKSSNGTFVNDERLSLPNETSSLFKVFSGDTIQFGVDVTENTKKESDNLVVMHNGIIARIRLYHPDGTEAIRPQNSASSVTVPLTTNVDLFLLTQYLKEGTHKEQSLLNKLNALENILDIATKESQNAWNVLVKEDRLLSQIESLQTKIHILSSCTNLNSDEAVEALRKQNLELEEEKERIKSHAEATIGRIIKEQCTLSQSNSRLSILLRSTSEECNRLKDVCDNYEREFIIFAEGHDKQLREIEDMQFRVKNLEEKINLTAKESSYELIKIGIYLEMFENKEKELKDSLDTLDELKTNYINLLNELEEIKKNLESYPICNESTEEHTLPCLTNASIDSSCNSVEEKNFKLLSNESFHNGTDSSYINLLPEQTSLNKTELETHNELLNEVQEAKTTATLEGHVSNSEFDIAISTKNYVTHEQKLIDALNELNESNKRNKMKDEMIDKLKSENDNKAQLINRLKEEFMKNQNSCDIEQLQLKRLSHDLVEQNNVQDNLLDQTSTDESKNKHYLEKFNKEYEELNRLRYEHSIFDLKENALREQIEYLRDELETLSYQNKMASVCAIVPLLILSIAIIFAYYPSVSSVTGTLES